MNRRNFTHHLLSSIKCFLPFSLIFPILLTNLFTRTGVLAYIDPKDTCYIGFTHDKPPSTIYTEYREGEDNSFTISFPIELCEGNKEINNIGLQVSKSENNPAEKENDEPGVGIPVLKPLPSIISVGYSHFLESEDQISLVDDYFRIVRSERNREVSDSYSYRLDVIFTKLTPKSTCYIEIDFTFSKMASYSAESKWVGHLIVEQRAKIGAVNQDTVQSIDRGELISDIFCGRVMGEPKPKIVWECAGNQNFWIMPRKDSKKIKGPHTSENLTLYEFGDDKNCQGDGRHELICKIENEIHENNNQPVSYYDERKVDTSQAIKSVDNDKAACKNSGNKQDDNVCSEYIDTNPTNNRIQFNSTHKLNSFMSILTFKSTHRKGQVSVCEKVMQNLVCNFFASDCKRRGKALHCRKECEIILNSCNFSPDLPLLKRFCDYFSVGSRGQLCEIDFMTGLSLFENKTQVSVTNNSVFTGVLYAPDNQTCENWGSVDTKHHLLRSNYKDNFCRATRAPEDNILRCYSKTADEYIQCWPEKPVETSTDKPPIELENRCDIVCKMQGGFKNHWKVVIVGFFSVLGLVIILIVLSYCCCCKRPSVRMVPHDANRFHGMPLRQNPMYKAADTGNQSRIIPNTPDPSLGMGHPDMRGMPRFPNVMQASRNRYVMQPTPENSLGRPGTPSGPNMRFQGPGFRAHSPAIPGVPMNRCPPPMGYGYGSGGRDSNPLAKFEYDRNKIQYIHDIGSGAFGYVFRAKAPGLGRRDMSITAGAASSDASNLGTEVAVKMLKDDATEEQMADFVNEAKLMSSFNHPNIIKLLGVCSVGKPFCLLLEYMKNRDLSDFLRKNGPESDLDVKERVHLSIADLILICQQVASGMSYISEKNYIHRDLATRNCLVSESMAVKISDFGLSQFIGTKEFLQIDDNDAIPIRWIAPEALHSNRYSQ